MDEAIELPEVTDNNIIIDLNSKNRILSIHIRFEGFYRCVTNNFVARSMAYDEHERKQESREAAFTLLKIIRKLKEDYWRLDD